MLTYKLDKPGDQTGLISNKQSQIDNNMQQQIRILSMTIRLNIAWESGTTILTFGLFNRNNFEVLVSNCQTDMTSVINKLSNFNISSRILTYS